MSIETVSFLGLPHCLKLSNGDIDLIITTAVGPRILFFGTPGGRNVFGQFPDASKETALGTWRPVGGHRLWVAPELFPATYAPDNDPVEHEVSGDLSVTVRQPADAAGIAKQLRLTLAPTGSGVIVEQTITSHNLWPVHISAWGISIVETGTSIVPRVPFRSHDEVVAPSQPLALCAFTDLQDSRFTLGLRYLLLHGDAAVPSSQKLGLRNKEGWCAHLSGDQLFLKQFTHDEREIYPDYGVNTEVYTEGRFQELELLGPQRIVAPGDSLTLVERWSLHQMPGASAVARDPDQLHIHLAHHLDVLLASG